MGPVSRGVTVLKNPYFTQSVDDVFTDKVFMLAKIKDANVQVLMQLLCFQERKDGKLKYAFMK